MSANFTPNQNEYENLTPFKTWLLLQINTWGMTNFPFVESDFDELTNYGMMLKLMNAVNDVISNENLVEQDVTNLFGAFTELQTYVNNYFDNLDVQDEINEKLDLMASDGTLTNLIESYMNPYIIEQNNKINVIEQKVESATSGSPLVASSTSEMTDTDRVYVNTTDGNWYYYDGDSWEIGGVYQSTGISPTDPIIVEINEKIDDCIKTYENIFDKTAIVLDKSPKSTTMDDLADTPGVNCSGLMPCKGGTTYSFSSHISGQNNVFFYLANGNYAFRLPIVEQSDGSWQVTTHTGNLAPSYMRFQYAPAYVDLDTFMVVEGAGLPNEYQPYGKYINPNYLREEIDAIQENTQRIEILEDSFSEQNNIIDIFNKGVCIGDSITSGTFNYTSPSSGYLVNTNYSYPMYLHKLTNIEIDNYGRGGYTAPQYASAYSQHDWTGYDFAIIMFGINDVLQNVSTSDSMAGITTIINDLKSYNNNIKIFLSTITPAYTDGNNLFDDENDAIRNLANSLANVYLVDLNQISRCHKNTPYVQGHLTALGYNQTAREFMYSISNIIKNNMNDFKNVQFIGTNYNYQ